MNERHSFSIREGLWWCDDEDCISESCTDGDRCSNQCVCNDNVNLLFLEQEEGQKVIGEKT